MKKEIVLYMHGGSGNKGCEAIVRSTVNMLNQQDVDDIQLWSWNPEEDKRAGLGEICRIIKAKENLSLRNFKVLWAVVLDRVFNKHSVLRKQQFLPFFKHDFSNAVAFSIGGDNYCYKGCESIVILHDKKLRSEVEKMVLWGCSIAEENLTPIIRQDLALFDAIICRESITYSNLIKAGVDNVRLYPDPAFTLSMQETILPDRWVEGNIIGINLSPYAFPKENYEKVKDSYCKLIEYILNETNMKIAFIPHVNKQGNSDYSIMHELWPENNDRIIRVENQVSATEVKFLISKCRLFIGARTHATIAAYSTGVPTLVLGYSVKSKGIAKDIFENFGNWEHYVVDVHILSDSNFLISRFNKLLADEQQMRTYLASFMPGYIQKAYLAMDETIKFINA